MIKYNYLKIRYNKIMKYEKIWNKVLSPNETVEYEFSIGQKYINFSLIFSGILIFLIFSWISITLAIILFLGALFYYDFYLKAANAYALTNKRVLIHRGWLSTHMTSVDYQKITDIKVREHFLDRIITQTGHIAINTAGANLTEIVIVHIDSPYEVKKKIDMLKDKILSAGGDQYPRQHGNTDD